MERAAPTRLLSLDVFRGLTIAGMLLVNNPGDWGAIYAPLEHAEWNGWTPTDVIFPFFLFIVGVTTHLSLTARRGRGATDRDIMLNVIRRGAIIVLLGWLMAGFPYYPLTRITEIRLPGVLPRIGVAYILGALLTIRTTLKQQIIILAVLLYGYWILQTLVPVPGQHEIGALLLNRPDATLSAWLDRTLLGGHLWISSKTWDPEGLLSTIPSVGTVILGVITGRWLTRSDLPMAERLNGMFVAGSIGMVVGLMWNWSFPINKSLWTSSYVMFTAGMGCVALAACVWIVDVHDIRWWTKPFVIFGTNPILAFVGSGVLARIIYSLIKVPYNGETISLEAAIYRGVFAGWLEPRNASLAFALLIVLFWLAILTVLYRKKIFLKV
ncbi:MAG: acyltransferase family protein [Gemmatimonadaceae bacterium]